MARAALGDLALSFHGRRVHADMGGRLASTLLSIFGIAPTAGQVFLLGQGLVPVAPALGFQVEPGPGELPGAKSRPSILESIEPGDAGRVACKAVVFVFVEAHSSQWPVTEHDMGVVVFLVAGRRRRVNGGRHQKPLAGKFLAQKIFQEIFPLLGIELVRERHFVFAGDIAVHPRLGALDFVPGGLGLVRPGWGFLRGTVIDEPHPLPAVIVKGSILPVVVEPSAGAVGHGRHG